MATKVFAPPLPRSVFAWSNQNLPWAIAFGEWIDNALDAGAKTVEIVCAGKSLAIRDDGNGCADPVRVLQYGARQDHATTAQGVFGAGGKDAILSVGGMRSHADVVSYHGGMLRRASVSWSDYFSDGGIMVFPERQAAGGGTTISIQDAARTPPKGKDWDKLLERLGYMYTPALEQGAQIKFKRNTKWEPLLRWTPPPIDGEMIDTTITVAGKQVHVRCGVVQAGAQYDRQGFTYYHGRRVINPASNYGCGAFGSARICGQVWLDGQWPRSKNKDALNHDHPTVVELYERIAEVCAPVLRRAEAASQELVSEVFADRLNTAVNAMLANAKARRSSPSKKSEGHEPTGTGGKHRRAAAEQPGETFVSGGARAGRFRVEFDKQGGTAIGRLRPPSVILNLDNAAVDALRASGAVEPIAILACAMIVAGHCTAPTDQFILRGMSPGASMEDFENIMGQLLAGGLSMDGKPALRVLGSEAA